MIEPERQGEAEPEKIIGQLPDLAILRRSYIKGDHVVAHSVSFGWPDNEGGGVTLPAKSHCRHAS